MKGTEKQIKYANDLVAEFKSKVDKVVSKGKADRIQNRIEILEFVENCEDAHLVIEIMNNWTSFPKENPVHGERGIINYFNL